MSVSLVKPCAPVTRVHINFSRIGCDWCPGTVRALYAVAHSGWTSYACWDHAWSQLPAEMRAREPRGREVFAPLLGVADGTAYYLCPPCMVRGEFHRHAHRWVGEVPPAAIAVRCGGDQG